MAKLISRRYAEALFELAVEKDCVDLFNDEVMFVYGSMKENNDFMAVLNHPEVLSEEKTAIIDNTFKGKISDDIIGLFHLVFRKNREAELIEILEVFLDKVRQYKGITTAFVSSAKELSESQINEIKDKLSKNLNKQVNIETKVEPELIGGVRILVDGHVIDGTIKKQLDELKKQLLNIQTA